MKGILLAGGSGSRLFPITHSLSKQLLPVYDKPMIYYPLSMLMLAGIRDILLITTPWDLALFQRLLGDGSQLGINIRYQVQNEPKGLAEAYIIGRDFVQGHNSCLVLGDNIFYGHGLPELLRNAAMLTKGARIFAYAVQYPQRYGVVDFDEHGRAVSLEEKPQKPRSNFAVPGIYFFDARAADYAAELKPSSRNELEITDLNKKYLNNKELDVIVMGRGIAWLDAGTHESLLQASNFVQTVQERQGLMISCPEEIAFREGYIDRQQLLLLSQKMGRSSYGHYLRKLAEIPA